MMSDIWQKSPSGILTLDRRLRLLRRRSCASPATRRACRSPHGGKRQRSGDKVKNGTTRFDNLDVVNLAEGDTKALAELASFGDEAQVMIQDGEVTVNLDEAMVTLTARPLEDRPVEDGALKLLFDARATWAPFKLYVELFVAALPRQRLENLIHWGFGNVVDVVGDGFLRHAEDHVQHRAVAIACVEKRLHLRVGNGPRAHHLHGGPQRLSLGVAGLFHCAARR